MVKLVVYEFILESDGILTDRDDFIGYSTFLMISSLIFGGSIGLIISFYC
jgi:hypothetical protein